MKKNCRDSSTDPFSPFGGGDWVAGIDGITNRERDLRTMSSPESYGSWQDPGKAAGRAHASQAHSEKREYHGKIGQSVKNGRVCSYGQGLPAGLRQHSDGRWYNESNLGEGPLPPGFKSAGAWWVLEHHQDPNAWPVHENGRTDRDELQAAHMNGVLTIPPPPGATMTTNHFDCKVYDAEHDSDSR